MMTLYKQLSMDKITCIFLQICLIASVSATNDDKNMQRWRLLETKTFILSVSRIIDGESSDVSFNIPKSGPESDEGSNCRQHLHKENIYLALVLLTCIAIVLALSGKLIYQTLRRTAQQDKSV
ncbi:hypothetical protein Q5P01_000147 [Channa striata]|uniref:Uncharacterized protein n=1 Tax=Channa striata TaxID=64152 RepID=A0AA88LN23_CHASR|nr:hypothetical protein Q5P01_000147 [Channa striata]